MNRCSDVARVRHSPVICVVLPVAADTSDTLWRPRPSTLECRHLFLTSHRPFMPIVHEHNLARPIPKQCQFGIRLKLRSTDPFKNLVGAQWTKEHWFATREERDRALKEMSGRYVYFRPGDQPSLEFEKVDK
jgi:hypothetical protein